MTNIPSSEPIALDVAGVLYSVWLDFETMRQARHGPWEALAHDVGDGAGLHHPARLACGILNSVTAIAVANVQGRNARMTQMSCAVSCNGQSRTRAQLIESWRAFFSFQRGEIDMQMTHTTVATRTRNRVGRPMVYGPRRIVLVRVPIDIHDALRAEQEATGLPMNAIVNRRLEGVIEKNKNSLVAGLAAIATSEVENRSLLRTNSNAKSTRTRTG